jgi:hypothetical protein
MFYAELALLLSTAALTVFAVLCTVRAVRAARDAAALAHTLRVNDGRLEVACADIEALKKRVKKWIGTESRLRRRDLPDEDDVGAPVTEYMDPEVAAMLALQNGSSPVQS